MSITKQKQTMPTGALPETTHALMEGKKFFVGQLRLPVAETMGFTHLETAFGKTIIRGQFGECTSEAEEARVLAHPEVVKAFDQAAAAINAWENSL